MVLVPNKGWINTIRTTFNMIMTQLGTNQILLLADDDTKIIPGHKNRSNKKELLVYRDMLVIVRDTVKKKIEEGKTKDEIINDSTITKKYDDLDYGTWFIKPEVFRETVYESLINSKS